MKICMLAILICIPFLSGCGTTGLTFPPGSYVEGGGGYSKDTGTTANVVVHIPLLKKKGVTNVSAH